MAVLETEFVLTASEPPEVEKTAPIKSRISVIMERSIKKERENARTFGVVVFIVDGVGNVYTSQENESNEATGKKAGDYSVICETRNYRESWAANMYRGISEESGIPDDKISSVIDFGDYRVWETQFKDGVWATVVVLKCKDSTQFMSLVGTNGDTDGVKPFGFVPRDRFESLNLREGVRNIVEDYGDWIFSKNEEIDID
jgi:hypothetical protein